MTREKRISALANLRYVKSWKDKEGLADETIDICIETLQQEPCEDIKEIREVMSCDADAETKCKMISNILTAKPHYFKEQEPCDDCISRQAVLDYIYNDLGLGDEENGNDVERQVELERSYKYVESLLPVNPPSKRGQWLPDKNEEFIYILKCSECGFINEYGISEDGSGTYKYCPNCGAKM